MFYFNYLVVFVTFLIAAGKFIDISMQFEVVNMTVDSWLVNQTIHKNVTAVHLGILLVKLKL